MDRHGARPVLFISLTLMGISFLIRPAMTELWHWYGLSFLQFIGISGITALPAGRLIAIWFPSSQGRIMGITVTGINFGGITIPFIVNVALGAHPVGRRHTSSWASSPWPWRRSRCSSSESIRRNPKTVLLGSPRT